MSPANVESMMYVGDRPWHGLGTELANVATAEEAITAAQLDWTVSKRPLFTNEYNGTVEGKYTPITGAYGIIRDTDNRFYHVVTDSYKPLQNREAFSFFDKIVNNGEAIYHTAGSLDHGGRIWILAKLPENIVLLRQDVIEEYLLLTNSHDGSIVVTACNTPVRVVCQNTLTAALSEARNMVTIKHVGDFQVKFQQAAEVMGLAKRYFADFAALSVAMTEKNIVYQNVVDFGTELFPIPDDDKIKEANREYVRATMEQRRNKLQELVLVGKGTDIPGVKGSLYGLYQAAVELADFHLKDYRSDNNRMKSIWWGESAELKQRALRITNKMLD